MNTGNFSVVGIRSIGGGDDVEGWYWRTVFGPLYVLCELVAVSIGTGDQDVNAVTCGRGCQGCIGSDGHGHTVKHGDGDAVRDVESGSADAVGLNGPLSNGGRFPAHLVEQQVGGDITDLPCGFIDLYPGERSRINPVVVSIVEIGEEIHGIVSGHFEHGARRGIGVVGRSTNAHRVKETVINGHVDGDHVACRTVIVRC